MSQLSGGTTIVQQYFASVTVSFQPVALSEADVILAIGITSS